MLFKIAHFSDLHCGSPYFLPNLADRAIMEINELEPDIVVCSVDLTTFGFQQEYAEAKTYLERLECEHVVIVPGNHDSGTWATSTSRSCSASAGAPCT